MYPCEKVDLSFLQDAPQRFTNSVDLAVTPDQAFEVLA
ncbi:MAG: SRPBCC family protein, partial [Mycobacterium sp.]